MGQIHFKDPNAKKPYGVAWGTWLVSGDTIVTSEWIVPDGLTGESESATDTQATIWLSGGTDGVDYEVTNRITTVQGMIDDRTIRIKCRNC